MKRILIVVDMQNGFARCDQTKQLLKEIEQLLNRKLFDSVIATRFVNDSNSIYEKLFNWRQLQNAYDQAIPEGIMRHVDYVAEKYIYNCVNASFIQKLCQLNDGAYPEEVFLCGADTDCCVMIIATALFENNIRPIVLTKYCKSNGGDAAHDAGLLCMQRLIGKKQLVDVDPKSVEDLNCL